METPARSLLSQQFPLLLQLSVVGFFCQNRTLKFLRMNMITVRIDSEGYSKSTNTYENIVSENNFQVKTESNFFGIKEDTMKRILTIDGGGIKGVCPASFLATVDNSIEGNIADYFDLICRHLYRWNYCFGARVGIICQGNIDILRRIWSRHLWWNQWKPLVQVAGYYQVQ